LIERACRSNLTRGSSDRPLEYKKGASSLEYQRLETLIRCDEDSRGGTYTNDSQGLTRI
jgi:hypothetical protein